MHILRPALALAACFAVATPALAHREDANINAVYAKLRAARTAHDIDGMAGAFAGAGLLIDARPNPALGGGELAGQLKPMVERMKSEGVKVDTAYRIERRSVIGPSTGSGQAIAIDAGYMRQTMTRPDGQAGTRYARFLVTMQRDATGQWRIIGDASMTVPQAQFDGVKRAEGLAYDG